MTTVAAPTIEDLFEAWSKPLSQAQKEKCDRAVGEVTKAIQDDSKLGPLMAQRRVQVLPQGSYANDVNVSDESDVDVCVLCTDTFIWNAPAGLTLEMLGGIPATYSYDVFKDDVERALVNHFGRAAVTRGNKAFDIKETKLRVEADAAPCFEYRRYYYAWTNRLEYHSGTALWPDDGYAWIANFPRQQKDRGEEKNARTNWRYKKAVRILKNVRYGMIADDLWDEDRTCSFLLECAIWNQEDEAFSGSSLTPMIRRLLGLLYERTGPQGDADDWFESNGIKLLFKEGQQWTKQDVRDFVEAAWVYLGFNNG